MAEKSSRTVEPDAEDNNVAVSDPDPGGASNADTDPHPDPDVEIAIEDHAEHADGAANLPPSRRIRSPRRVAFVAILVTATILGGLVGWLGYRMYQSHHATQQRAAFVQAARQGAVNLTTIDWQHADDDVRRVLDSATGTFYDGFAKRSQPFIDVVKEVKSKSEGTVILAGLESITGDQARVLVVMSVKTTNAGAPESSPRSWRMRIDVQKVGADVKVSNVEFVP